MRNIVYRYACLMRPPGPGAVPRDGLEYCNADPYIHPFTGRECCGYCDYDRKLTDKEVSDYELDYVMCTMCMRRNEPATRLVFFYGG